MDLKIKRIQEGAKIPFYSHADDAGLDLFSVEELALQPGEAQAIATGIKMAIPKGYVGLIWDKSGISLQSVHRLAGVVDSSYRGEIKVVMINLGRDPFIIEKGMKIAQMLVQPIQMVNVMEVDDLEATSRGENGFGSTGKY